MSFPLSAGGTTIVDTPPFWKGRGGELPTNFSKRRGGLTGPQLLEGVAGKEGADFFQEAGLQFSCKNKLKSEIFNDKKKFISKNIFLCHN